MNTPTYSAFWGEPRRKQAAINTLSKHLANGRVMPWPKTSFGDPPMMCSVMGATVEADSDADYEAQLCIPATIARLHETLLFHCGEMKPPAEGQDGEERFELAAFARDYPVQWLEAVRVGADLRAVLPQFVGWLLQDFLDAERWPLVAASQGVGRRLLDHFEQVLAGQTVPPAAWAATRRAAVQATDVAPDAINHALCTFMESVAWPPQEAADEWPSAFSALWLALEEALQQAHCTPQELGHRQALRLAFDAAKSAPEYKHLSVGELIQSHPQLSVLTKEMNSSAARARRQQVAQAALPQVLQMAQRQFEALLCLTRTA